MLNLASHPTVVRAMGCKCICEGEAGVFLRLSVLFGCCKPSHHQIEFASVIAVVSFSSSANLSPITFC